MANKIYIDYYKFLGIPFGADSDQVKNAYKNKLIENHPDKQEYGTEAEKEIARKNLEIAKDALDTLTSEQSRKVYDLEYRKNNGMQMEEYQDESATYFNQFFDEYFNDFSASFQSYFNEEPVKKDFSQVIELENEIAFIEKQIEEAKKIYFSLLNEKKERQVNDKAKIEALKMSIKSSDKFKEAQDYIDRFHKKGRNPLTSLLLSKKEYEQFDYYLKVKDTFEESIDSLKQELEEENKNLDKEIKEKEKNYHQFRKDKDELIQKYMNHPLRYDYEKAKRESETSKKR